MANLNHFNLTLDTQAPSGAISAQRYYKANATAADANALVITLSGSPAYMKVWFNTTPTGTKEDAGFTSAEWEVAATAHKTEFTADGDYYYHLVLMDDVGNQSGVYNTTITTFDTQVPFVRKYDSTSSSYVKGVSINDDTLKTKSRDIRVKFWFDDPLKEDCSAGNSGVVSGTISGNIVGSPVAINPTPEEITAGYGYRDVQFTAEAEDGTQTIKVTVTDAAGNTSEETALSQDSIILDTTAASGVIVLKTADKSATLPTWINFTAFTALIDLDNVSTDVVGYKLWGDIVGKTTEPEDYTTVAAGTDPIEVSGLNFTTGDAVKTVNAKIIDDAGNETTLTAVTVKLDQTPPTVSITRDEAYISNVDGFDEVVITPTVNMNPGSQEIYSPCVSWSLKVNGTQVRNGSTEAGIAAWTLTSADSMVANQNNTITLTVTDEAQNTTTSASVSVYLDTEAPSISLPTLNTWYKATFDVVLTTADAGAGVDKVYVWANTTETDTTIPGTCSAVTITAASQTISKDNIDWNGLAQSGSNYIHAAVVDKVGNVRHASASADPVVPGKGAKFGYDSEKPTNCSITLPDYTNTATINASLVASDATSDVAYYKLSGDVVNEDIWKAFTGSPMTVSITLTDGDGTKTVNAVFKDTAGNESDLVFDTTELDTAAPTGKIQLYTTGTSESVVPDITNQAAFKARFYDMDDNDVTATLQLTYKLYGDFSYDSQSATGITEAAAEWKTVVLDSGTQVMTISNCFFTSGDGSKTINVKFKDNAGNISTVASQTRTYDTTAPVVEVSDVDYNKVSKQHTLRRVDNVEIAGKYNDEVNFKFTPDSLIQAYKVCAYLTQAAAEAVIDPASEAPILQSGDGAVYAKNTAYAVNDIIKNTVSEVTTYYIVNTAITAAENTGFDAISSKLTSRGVVVPASINMHATGLNQQTVVSSLIKGADFEAALGGTGNDGARFVVVYVQDLGGTWSAAADFTA